MLAEARKVAESEGVTLNQRITLAHAEKISAMRIEECFEQRARRTDSTKVSQIRARLGEGNPPVEIDEPPSGGHTKEGEFFADWNHPPPAAFIFSPVVAGGRRSVDLDFFLAEDFDVERLSYRKCSSSKSLARLKISQYNQAHVG